MSAFPRGSITSADGLPTLPWQRFFQTLWDKTGGAAGDILAATIKNIAAGSITATNVQDALNQLDTSKVPVGRKVNGHALSADVVLSAADVGADATGTSSADMAAHVAAPDPHSQYALDSDLANYVPTTRSVNGHALSSDVTLSAADVGAQPDDATLTALAGQNWAKNALPIGSGADTMVQVAFAANTFPARASSGDLVAKTISDFGLSLVDDADAAAARTTLGYVSGTFTATATGLTTAPTCTVNYSKWGDIVVLSIGGVSGTSNATSFTLTGVPAAITPAASMSTLGRAQDNSGPQQACLVQLTSTGTLTFSKDANSGAFTSSGTKSAPDQVLVFHMS